MIAVLGAGDTMMKGLTQPCLHGEYSLAGRQEAMRRGTGSDKPYEGNRTRSSDRDPGLPWGWGQGRTLWEVTLA